MPGRSHVQKSFQQLHQRSGGNLAHTHLRGGRPYSRILLRIVRRLTPSISAARVRFPPVLFKVVSSKRRSSSRIDVPAWIVACGWKRGTETRLAVVSSPVKCSG